MNNLYEAYLLNYLLTYLLASEEDMVVKEISFRTSKGTAISLDL